jgi:uncharacterized membrane protein YbhN (UPF0104 family)
MDKFAPLAAIASPVIALVMQVLKGALGEKKKLIPFINLVVGVAVCVIVAEGWAFEINMYQAVIVGLLVGGTATGLYEATKNLAPKKD